MAASNRSILLIHHPTIALKLCGIDESKYSEFKDKCIYLGNIYRRVMPASLTRVASIIEQNLDYDVKILDVRMAGYDRTGTLKTFAWEGYELEVQRVGGVFAHADNEIASAEWLGLASHFTFESGVIRDFISHAKKINPYIKVMVGGADVRVRPEEYIGFGADLAFLGDIDPKEIANFDGKPRIVDDYKYPFDELVSPTFSKLDNLSEYSDSHDGPTPNGVTTPIGFIYFTRGCPRECNFCESRKTGFEVLNIDKSIEMIENYHAAGIQTLNIVDDNLLFALRKKNGREYLIEIFTHMRKKGFAWEFPNGLEIGLLMNGKVDEELMATLFSHSVKNNQIIGAYRLYVPVETFDARQNYRKLKPIVDQNKIINCLSALGLPQIDFGIVLQPDATKETFLHIEQGYSEIKNLLHKSGKTKARYAIFHLIPIAEFRNMTTKYSVSEFPEGWNFHFPVYDGKYFSARELFERKLDLIKRIDFQSYMNMTKGEYSYS